MGAFLAAEGYGTAFIDRHILPMGAAIWSTPAAQMLDYPAKSFIQFFDNHGLLRVAGHPAWRTVIGGSREYVQRLIADGRFQLRCGKPVERLERKARGVQVVCGGEVETYDRVLVASHSDQALAMLSSPSALEREILSAVPYSSNIAVLHRDRRLMPKRKAVWSSWNFIGRGAREPVMVSYWMNRLQPLPTPENFFVTLNPPAGLVIEGEVARFAYAHPNFSASAMAAQQRLWEMQGQNQIWFAGAWCGSGFHEDGIQAGLAAAEHMGGVRRPWTVAAESGRIATPPQKASRMDELEAAE
jgi:predicted NAD/FAD-binding protein